ncbi:hypothetical protein FH972_024611 [Carpinus fangiana]|uniref:AB hydrolase-1 domain-containing protein n=1 Tax=Carpinus fangiana TaxID=176857 RepID=A0A5N6KZE6_9ROSI|nr:hypothetical protein FH972_024611 [Carpinus fangiana]
MSGSLPEHDSSETLVLPDGRKLGYSQFGSLTGKPVVFVHGHPGSRLEGAHLHELGLRLGARIIATDRPGVGLSSPHPNRTILDFPKDLERLTDHLKLEKYGILGVSGGGPYALACAYALPKKKLRCMSIVCGLGPVSEIGMRGATVMHQVGFKMYPYTPAFVNRWYWRSQTGGSLDWSEEKRLEHHLNNYPKPKTVADEKNFEVMTDKTNARLFLRSVQATFAQGFDPTLQDGKLLSKPLGFRIEDIRADLPVRLWYGNLDVNVPLHHGETIAKRLGDQATLTVLDEPHASIFFKWREQFLQDLHDRSRHHIGQGAALWKLKVWRHRAISQARAQQLCPLVPPLHCGLAPALYASKATSATLQRISRSAKCWSASVLSVRQGNGDFCARPFWPVGPIRPKYAIAVVRAAEYIPKVPACSLQHGRYPPFASPFLPAMRKEVFVTILFAFAVSILLFPFLVTSPVSYLKSFTKRQSYIFIFGDSYTTSAWDPYNPQLQPSELDPLGSGNATITTSAGKGLTNWVGKLVLDHLPLPNTAFAYNYATGAATVNCDRYDFVKNVSDFRGQTEEFKDIATRPAFKASEGVAVVFFGINDLFAHTMVTAQSHNDTIIVETMDDYWTQMENLYDAGLRNFVILLAQPLERIPKIALWPDRVYVDSLAANRAEWSRQLLQRIDVFRAAHDHVAIGAVDLVPVFDNILDNSEPYAVPDNMCAAPDGISCLWSDTIHAGQVLHDAIAASVAAELSRIGFV